MKGNEIQKVEDALDGLIEINKRDQEDRDTRKFEYEKSRLQKFLYDLPRVIYKRTDNRCTASINGIHFSVDQRSYTSNIVIEHKIVRRLFHKRWVAKRKFKYEFYSEDLFEERSETIHWVLEKHLEALKFEENI